MRYYFVLNSFVYISWLFFAFSVFSLCVSGCMLGSQRASSVAEHSRGPTEERRSPDSHSLHIALPHRCHFLDGQGSNLNHYTYIQQSSTFFYKTHKSFTCRALCVLMMFYNIKSEDDFCGVERHRNDGLKFINIMHWQSSLCG